jgi:hypothetical protein
MEERRKSSPPSPLNRGVGSYEIPNGDLHSRRWGIELGGLSSGFAHEELVQTVAPWCSLLSMNTVANFGLIWQVGEVAAGTGRMR